MLVLNRYLEAYELRPTRVEPLAQVVKHYRQTAQYRLGYLFGSQAMAIPMPEDLLFIERPTYEYELPLDYAVCCSALGMKLEAARIAERLLSQPSLPEHARRSAEDHCDWTQMSQTPDRPKSLSGT